MRGFSGGGGGDRGSGGHDGTGGGGATTIGTSVFSRTDAGVAAVTVASKAPWLASVDEMAAGGLATKLLAAAVMIVAVGGAGAPATLGAAA